MSRKKISTTIYVTPEQSERLRLLHERTKVPVAVYIREGIDLVLRQYGHLLPGQLPLERAVETPSPPAVSDTRSERTNERTNERNERAGDRTERPRADRAHERGSERDVDRSAPSRPERAAAAGATSESMPSPERAAGNALIKG